MKRGKLLATGVMGVGLTIMATDASAQSCVPPPTAVRDLDIPRFYGDAKGSIVDPTLQRAHDAAVAPLTAWLRQVTQDADKAMTRGSETSRAAAALCAVQALEAWARQRAYLGTMAQPQAEYQRKWDLAGASLAYLKVRRFASASQRRTIEPWLIAWADAAAEFQLAPGRARNNHLYWLGLGQLAVGVATDSAPHRARALAIYDEALTQIDADGFLALELERGARAAFYHVFAVVPLVVMAEMADALGQDWYQRGQGALHRLVLRAAESLTTVAPMSLRAGVAQDLPVNARAGWLPLYQARFPDRLSGALPHIPRQHRWLGGDVMQLRSALRTEAR